MAKMTVPAYIKFFWKKFMPNGEYYTQDLKVALSGLSVGEVLTIEGWLNARNAENSSLSDDQLIAMFSADYEWTDTPFGGTIKQKSQQAKAQDQQASQLDRIEAAVNKIAAKVGA